MIDSVVKLTEKLSELLKYREEQRERRFSVLAQPVFGSLKVVHKDYLDIFAESHSAIEGGQSLQAIADSVEARRLEEEAERSALSAKARVFASDPNLSDLQPFFGSALHYLRPERHFVRNSRTMLWLQQIRASVRAQSALYVPAADGIEERMRLRIQSELHLHQLRSDWDAVCAQYAMVEARSAK